MNSRRGVFVGLFALELCVSCAKPKAPTITPRSAQVVAVEPQGLRLRVTFEVSNPNAFPLVVQAVDGTFTVGAGATLGRAHADLGSSIPAQGTSSVDSELSVGFANLAALAPFAFATGPVPFGFQGTAKLGGSELNVELPFTLAGELSRADLLAAGLNGLGAAPAPSAGG